MLPRTVSWLLVLQVAGGFDFTLRSARNTTRLCGPDDRGPCGEWECFERSREWRSNETAFVVVDMWDKHWCPSATSRTHSLASPIARYINAARAAGGVIVWAPSETTSFYHEHTARLNTLELPTVPRPPRRSQSWLTAPTPNLLDAGTQRSLPFHSTLMCLTAVTIVASLRTMHGSVRSRAWRSETATSSLQ